MILRNSPRRGGVANTVAAGAGAGRRAGGCHGIRSLPAGDPVEPRVALPEAPCLRASTSSHRRLLFRRPLMSNRAAAARPAAPTPATTCHSTIRTDYPARLAGTGVGRRWRIPRSGSCAAGDDGIAVAPGSADEATGPPPTEEEAAPAPVGRHRSRNLPPPPPPRTGEPTTVEIVRHPTLDAPEEVVADEAFTVSVALDRGPAHARCDGARRA